MRRFYLFPGRSSRMIAQTTSGQFPVFAYPSTFPIPQTASGKSSATNESAQFPFTLSWSHYVFLLGLNDQERGFYEIEAAEQGWTLRELKRQFNSGLYERLALIEISRQFENSPGKASMLFWELCGLLLCLLFIWVLAHFW
jgi:hypothetical protein